MIRCVSFFGGGKIPKIMVYVINVNISAPSSSAFEIDYTFVTGSVVALFYAVVLIVVARHRAQVSNPVIGWIAVNVIYASWQNAVYV